MGGLHQKRTAPPLSPSRSLSLLDGWYPPTLPFPPTHLLPILSTSLISPPFLVYLCRLLCSEGAFLLCVRFYIVALRALRVSVVSIYIVPLGLQPLLLAAVLSL